MKGTMDQPYIPPRHPVSVKGVVLDSQDRVLLLRNERAEWELPGGRLEVGEKPEDCVAREVSEESGWQVEAGPLLSVWVYEPIPNRHVLIVTYGCRNRSADSTPVLSAEHNDIGLFTREEVPGLVMPQSYKDSVAAWFQHLDHTGVSLSRD
ncbi:NUDIX hydrolase [Streptacidiphilus albus]|uniref:NUDIX hydrolase n=1 Tax=Streptacidiphilus albus TaxID=105425 RepID=UPI000AAE075A|nr:NUDIX hydrolase [Streptacidiphilus albus]